MYRMYRLSLLMLSVVLLLSTLLLYRYSSVEGWDNHSQEMRAESCNDSIGISTPRFLINMPVRVSSSSSLDAPIKTASMWKRVSLDLNRSPPKSPSPALGDTNTGEVSSTSKAAPKTTSQEVNASLDTEKVKRRRAQVAKAVRKYYGKFNTEARNQAKETMTADEYKHYMNVYENIKQRNNDIVRSYTKRQKHLREQGDPTAIAKYSKRLSKFRAWYHASGKQKRIAKLTKKDPDNQDKPPSFSKRALQNDSLSAGLDAKSQDRGQIKKMTQLKKKREYQRRYRNSMSKKAEEEARKTLPPEEFKELQIKIKEFRLKRTTQAKGNYQRTKAKRLKGDEIAMKSYASRLEGKRVREEKQSVGKFLADGKVYPRKSKTVPLQEKSKLHSIGAADDSVDTELRLFRRAQGEIIHAPYPEEELSLLKRAGLDLNAPSEATPPAESGPSNSTEERPKKKRKHYYEQFTKKAQEEARNTLPQEKYEEYQERLQYYRQKRSSYGTARSQRIRIGRQTGDEKSIELYTGRLQRKKKRYQQTALGTFLASDSISQHDRESAKKSDADLHALLQQPLDHSSKKFVERKLHDRKKKRESYAENMNLYRSGDPKAKEWYEKKRESGRISMAKYNAARNQAKRSGKMASTPD